MTVELDPRGALRIAIDRRANDDVFRRLGVGARRCDLGDQGLYLAEELVRADRWLDGDDQREALAMLVLALLVAQRQGSTRLPLDATTGSTLRTLLGDIGRLAHVDSKDQTRILRTITNLTSTPRFNSVIGVGDARLPLIVDDNCLYTERSHWLEQRVAAALASRLAATATVPAAVSAAVPVPVSVSAAVPVSAAVTLSAEQLHAVTLATTSRLAIITGGPGTGKTAVAGAIVRALLDRGLAPSRIGLAAPTGKAANRLGELIAAHLACASPAAAAAPPPSAQTLHRLLGYRDRGGAGGADGFAHHARSPLPLDALIVDEASMIDLELMDALLDALPPAARLILIGDAHQLPAIDAGQILADLAAPGGAAADRVATLTHSHRADAADPRGRAVLAAAAAIRNGEPRRLFDTADRLATLRASAAKLAFSGVEWVDAPTAADSLAVAEALWRRFDGPAAARRAEHVFRFAWGDDGVGTIVPEQHDELEQLWSLLARARVLTVTRAQATGSIAVNAHLHELVASRLNLAGKPELVPGEPVMMTANDHRRGLFNGDQGIVVRADEGTGSGHRYRVVFRVGGRLVPFAIEALRDRLELAWAMTVHKSQGSELDAVAVLLPEDDLPLLTRELLYTAITRARTGVVLAGTRAILISGAKRQAVRHSGLAARLVAR